MYTGLPTTMKLKQIAIAILFSGSIQASEIAAAPLVPPGSTLIDLSHPYDETTIFWPTAEGFELVTDFNRILMTENIPAFENVARLDLLPASGFQVIALPMKINGGSGGPLRIVAVVP
jgi:kynurenine formamidase